MSKAAASPSVCSAPARHVVLLAVTAALLALVAPPRTPVAAAQTALKPTGRGNAQLPCRTPGRLIQSNALSAVSIYSPSQAVRRPARQPGFYGCTRGHRFHRLGPDPVSEVIGEGDALADPALAGRFAVVTTQFCSRAGCFGGTVRSVSLATGKAVAAPLGSNSFIRATVTTNGTAVYSVRRFDSSQVAGGGLAVLLGGAVWQLGRHGPATQLAFDPGLDPASLVLGGGRAFWTVKGSAQAAPVG